MRRQAVAVYRMWAAAASAMLALAASGCGGGAAAVAGDVTVRDSAGITIVENGAAPSTPLLVVDSVATVDIGERRDDDPDYQFSDVRHALRRGDGSILVANAGQEELRIYGRDGDFVRRIGRRGSGPGEFRTLGWVGSTGGDTILAFDYTGQRLSRFAPDGTFASSVILGGFGQPDQLSPYGALGDGRLLAGQADQFTRPFVHGDHRDTVTLQLVQVDGVTRDTLGRFPGDDYRVRIRPGISMSVSTVPYGRATRFSAEGGMIAIGTSDSYEILLLDDAGAIRRIVRRRAEPVAITNDDMAARVEEWQGRPVAPALRERFLAQVAEMPKPASMPAYQALLIDRVGRLWLREAAHVGEIGRWAVYAPDGSLLADLHFPERFTVTDAGADYVLGVVRDEYDVERVQLFRLRSPDGDA